MMEQYCCEMREYCDISPEECPIAKDNKAIADFDAAVTEVKETVKNSVFEIFERIKKAMIKDSGNRREFDTGSVRDMQDGKGRFDLLPWMAIWEVAKHCENGAKKYGEHNVDKGIPTHSFIDSAFRHLAKHTDGQTDEPHLIAAAWNILWAIQTEIKHPELKDIPWKDDGGED